MGPYTHAEFQKNSRNSIPRRYSNKLAGGQTQIHRALLATAWGPIKKSYLHTYFEEGFKVPPEKTQSHLNSQFPPEMTLFKSQ